MKLCFKSKPHMQIKTIKTRYPSVKPSAVPKKMC